MTDLIARSLNFSNTARTATVLPRCRRCAEETTEESGDGLLLNRLPRAGPARALQEPACILAECRAVARGAAGTGRT